MALLTRPNLHAEIDVRFPDNDKQLITPPIVRAFLHNLVDSALLAASDKLSLSKVLTLTQARALLATAPPTVEAGQYYAITGNWNAAGASSTVYVHGLSNLAYDLDGVLLDGGQYTRVSVDVVAGAATPVGVDAYTKTESDAQREALEQALLDKADLVNGRVPESELPARAIGNIDYRNRKGSAGGVIAITNGSYWHVSGHVTLNLLGLAVEDVFFLRISSFASNTYWTRLLATDGQLIGAYPQGTALLFRRNGSGPADLAVITVSSEYPSYAHAFVPDTVKAAVAGGNYTDNQLDTTPNGSVATMQFSDESYLYFCFLDKQITNGVLTYAWLRVARVGGSSGGGSGSGEQYTNEKAQDAVAALLAAGTHQGIEFTYDDAGNRLSAKVTATAGSTRPSQHQTFASQRLTAIQFHDSLPTSLSISPVSNLGQLATQVNYQDADNPGVWLTRPAHVAPTSDTAALAAMCQSLLDDMATIPAASLAIAAELQFLSYPLDSAQESSFFLSGLGGGQCVCRSGFFRTTYTGPPQGNLVGNSQFTDASIWTTYGGTVAIGGGQATWQSGVGIYQRINIPADAYEIRLRIANVDAGGSVQILAEVPGGAAAGTKSFYAAGDYTFPFTWQGGEIQLRVIATAGTVLSHFYCL